MLLIKEIYPTMTFFFRAMEGVLTKVALFFLSVLDTLYLTNIVSATVLVYLLMTLIFTWKFQDLTGMLSLY